MYWNIYGYFLHTDTRKKILAAQLREKERQIEDDKNYARLFEEIEEQQRQSRMIITTIYSIQF